MDDQHTSETAINFVFHFCFWFLIFGFPLAFWGLVCNAATQLALQLQQERIQAVRSNK